MSSDVKARIQADLKTARKARDRETTVLLTTILSDLRNREIERKGDLSDEDALEVLDRAVKQRNEAAEQMRSAGRDELAVREETQAEAIRTYLPEALSEEAVREIVRELVAGGADSMGPVMGKLMPRIKGRFDGREANRIVREELGG